MRVYIAGKITGDLDYISKFNFAEKRLRFRGHICMNPAALPGDFPYESYFPICLAMIGACEAVFFLKDWVDSPGARREFDWAQLMKKEIYYEERGYDLPKAGEEG